MREKERKREIERARYASQAVAPELSMAYGVWIACNRATFSEITR
jgi:hypothetical protein